MLLLIVYISLALGVSFLCSIMEAVLLSVSSSFVAQMEQEGKAAAAQLQQYKSNIDQPLAAILSLNTIAHTVGAAGAGAQAAIVFGEAYLGVISAILTFLILVFSEIIPKTLGAAYWRQMALPVVYLLKFTLWGMWPLVKMAELLTRLLTRGKQHGLIERKEFIALVDLGRKEGIFHKYESRILHNLFYIRDIRTRDIMTPRTVVFALDEQLEVAQAMQMHPEIPFSRIPLSTGSIDRITGFALKHEILRAVFESPKEPLSTIRRPLHVVEGGLSVHELFARLMQDGAHIALVVDPYGGTEGIVTMEDVFETLIGLEIVDEADTAEDMQELARKQWERRTRLQEKLLIVKRNG